MVLLKERKVFSNDLGDVLAQLEYRHKELENPGFLKDMFLNAPLPSVDKIPPQIVKKQREIADFDFLDTLLYIFFSIKYKTNFQQTADRRIELARELVTASNADAYNPLKSRLNAGVCFH